MPVSICMGSDTMTSSSLESLQGGKMRPATGVRQDRPGFWGHQVRADLSAAGKPARCNIVEFRFNV